MQKIITLNSQNTGERFLPWTETDETHYDHLHRYFFASQFVKGKKILDLGCGEGYGAEILSKNAKSVICIDSDKKTIQQAKKKYRSKKIKFLSGSITQVPITGENIFDVITCFEVIEHVKEQKKVLLEVKRLLKKHGLFIISTPNKIVYSKDEKYFNPHHEKELTLANFKTLLKSVFPFFQVYGQHAFTASNIWSLTTKKNQDFGETIIKKTNNKYVISKSSEKKPKYMIALASLKKHKSFKIGNRFLFDTGSIRTYTQRLENDIKKRNSELEKNKTHITNLKQDIQNKESEISKSKTHITNLKQDTQNKESEISKSKTYITNLKQDMQNKEAEQTKSKEFVSRLSKEISDKNFEIKNL